jgi:hypothetical protein
MLNFGKYKGQSIKDVLRKDSQYVKWLIKTNLIHKLDETDKETISYYLEPLKDIDVKNISEEDLIDILRKRGLLFQAEEYASLKEYDTVYYTIDSAYGFQCGSRSSTFNFRYLKHDIINIFSKELKL